MNINEQIRHAIARHNRSLGQRCRYAHAEIRRMAGQALVDLCAEPILPSVPQQYTDFNPGWADLWRPV